MKDVIKQYFTNNPDATPAFVFDLDKLGERVEKIRTVLDKKINLCYAIKANPFLIDKFSADISFFEVCSLGELEICKRANISPEKIVFSGVNKSMHDIEQAIDYGVSYITVESINQLEFIQQNSSRRKESLSVLLRLSSGNQFGMDMETIESIIDRRTELKYLTIVGIHYFAGTQRKNIVDINAELSLLIEWFMKLDTEYAFKVELFEYGPGLGVHYFTSDLNNELENLNAMALTLSKIVESFNVTVEMGRFFVASCGHYITRIDDVKKTSNVNYVIVDGGINHLVYSGQTMGMKTILFDHIKSAIRNQSSDDYVICGSLCTSNDILLRNVKLCDPNRNDFLVFHNAGAYTVTEGIPLLLSRPLPRVYYLSKTNGMMLERDFIRTDLLNCKSALLTNWKS